MADKQLVDCVASGYEWICPECGHLNKIIEYPHGGEVKCENCNDEFELNLPEHALE